MDLHCCIYTCQIKIKFTIYLPEYKPVLVISKNYWAQPHLLLSKWDIYQVGFVMTTSL